MEKIETPDLPPWIAEYLELIEKAEEKDSKLMALRPRAHGISTVHEILQRLRERRAKKVQPHDTEAS